jgi:hypothetical protein
MKKAFIVSLVVFISLGILGQLLISAGVIPKSTSSSVINKPTSTSTPTSTPSPDTVKEIVDPWTQWSVWRVDWGNYSLDFEKTLWNKYDKKDCKGMQDIADSLIDNNMESFIRYLMLKQGCP